MEKRLVQSANGIEWEDEEATAKVLASTEPKVLNRVINLETGSLSCEAAFKMMLARFYKPVSYTHLCSDYSRARGKLGGIVFKFLRYYEKIFDGIVSFYPGNIDYLNDKTASFDMSEKLMSEPRSVGSPFDKSRNVCHDKAAFLTRGDNPKVRLKCGKMVIRNFRTRIRYCCEKRGLSVLSLIHISGSKRDHDKYHDYTVAVHEKYISPFN